MYISYESSHHLNQLIVIIPVNITLESSESLALCPEAEAGPGAGGEPQLLTQRHGDLNIGDGVRVTRGRGHRGHGGQGLHQRGRARARH